MRTAERELNELLATQLGIINRSQVLALGLTDHQIERRVATGEWERPSRGIYRLTGAPRSWEQEVMTACVGISDAVASLLTAARLHRLVTSSPPTPDVTVGFARSARSPLAIVHRARLTPLDVTRVQGIPTTTVERTLVDLADPLGPVRLRRVVDRAMHDHAWLRPAAIEAAWRRSERAPGRHGFGKLLTALEPWRMTIRPGSPVELRLVRMLAQWGFPAPSHQVVITDGRGVVVARADVGWPEVRIALEYDSSAWHGPERWAADEARHRAIEAAGWTLLHADGADLRPGERALRTALLAAWPAEHALRAG